MKVVFFLLDGDTNGSSWLRALQYFPLFREAGIEPVAARPTPPAVYERFVESGDRRLRARVSFYGLYLFQRLTDVLRAGRFDVAFIQRDLFPFGPPIMERLLRRMNPRLVYDTDDAVYLRPSFTPDNVFQEFRWFSKVAEVVHAAHWVSVATPEIVDWARQYNPNVSLVPMAIDPVPYAAARAARVSHPDHPVIGWTGTRGSLGYLARVQAPLANLTARHNVRVRLITGAVSDAERAMPGVPKQVLRWSAPTILSDLADFDIGLVPLDDSEFERAKFPGKLLHCMALGVPCIVSPVGFAGQLVRHGENGLLARSPAEWQEHLEQLLSDASLRRRLAEGGLATVRDNYTIQKVAPLLIDGIHAASGRTG